jgi:hypothetical protein
VFECETTSKRDHLQITLASKHVEKSLLLIDRVGQLAPFAHTCLE